ncbi:MAG: PqqD family protein [Prevotellaceae bacterium]|nr:PqqD family protein [Candidatus Minthosoma equi]
MKIKKGFEVQHVCGEHVIIACGEENIDFSKVISLNETSNYLWENLEGKEFDVKTMAELLLKEYEVDEATATKDCQSLADAWMEAGLLDK